MPIYEYECRACGHTMDRLQKISDDPLTDCPACGQSELRKLVSAPRFRLKGAGWYETDFKTGDKRNLADGGKADKKADGDSAKPSTTDKKADSGAGKKAATGDGA